MKKEILIPVVIFIIFVLVINIPMPETATIPTEDVRTSIAKTEWSFTSTPVPTSKNTPMEEIDWSQYVDEPSDNGAYDVLGENVNNETLAKISHDFGSDFFDLPRAYQLGTIAAATEQASRKTNTPTPPSLLTRINPYSGYSYLVQDSDNNAEYTKQMVDVAKWAKVDPPYLWDFYNVVGGTYKQISFYYEDNLKSSGYGIIFNNYLKEDSTGATTFQNKNKKIYLIVKDAIGEKPAVIAVIYKNIEIGIGK